MIDLRVAVGARRFSLLVLFALGFGFAATSPSLAARPNTPVITEPETDGEIVSAADVHMETGPFSDPDPGDTHQCTDWEIWTLEPTERVWSTICIGGVEKLHTHLGDGNFEGSYAGRTELAYDTDYRLRVRHRASDGQYSFYAQRFFTSGSLTQVYPLEIDDVAGTPTPTWRNESGTDLFLPATGTPGSIFVESGLGELFLEFRGVDGSSNLVVNPPSLGEHKAVRVRVTGGSSALALPISRVGFTDGGGEDVVLYLPAMNLAANETLYLWAAASGATYYGDAGQTTPDFSNLAQGAPVPWLAANGYKVEVVATGFQLPVNIAFVPNPGTAPNDVLYYVTELYGTIKVVTNDGTISNYATNLLNFDPTGAFPGSGEQGLTGICVDAANGDVFATTLYDAAPPNGPHYPKVMRFTSADNGHTAATQSTILDMVGETQGQSHQISNISFGPDGKLYVHMGDGFDCGQALNLNSYRGKVLRLNANGSAPPDNPFYNAGNGISATDYVFAYGLRNPFGGAWRASDGQHYEVENGPEVNDRLAKVTAGTSYGWDCSNGSMTTNAIYNWVVPHAPVNIAFIESSLFGGSGFPASKLDHAFVTESGPTWASGPQVQGKRVVEFVLDGGGALVSGPTTLVEYQGAGKATAVGLASGPDGLYFTDLYKDEGFVSPIDPGANVLRIKFVGTVEFSSDFRYGHPPFYVQFTDESEVPGASAWHWNFGDGTTSGEQHPLHVYTSTGIYNVRLEVTGQNGIAVEQKNGYIICGEAAAGLQGEYWDTIDLTGAALTRIDPTIDFDWGGGSPDPTIGPDTYSARWTGRVSPDFSELYTFRTISDDGVRLWVNNQLVIDQWIDQAPTEWAGNISLQAGVKVDLKMEFYENGGGAVAKLYWESASLPREIVPQTHLYPFFPADVPPVAALPIEWGGTIPNPVVRPTPIRFVMASAGKARLSLVDAGGREVARLVDSSLRAGEQAVLFDPGRIASGVYFLKLTLDQSTLSRKLVVRK